MEHKQFEMETRSKETRKSRTLQKCVCTLQVGFCWNLERNRAHERGM